MVCCKGGQGRTNKDVYHFRPTNISNRHFTIKIETPKVETPNTNTFETSTIDYSKKTVKELISLCKENGVKGYYGKKKAELVVMLYSTTITNTIVTISAPKIDVIAKTPVKVEIQTLPLVDNVERVKRLREHLTLSKVNHEDQIMKLVTLKEAHTYCVIHGIAAQKYGPLLEKFICKKFKYVKNKAEDCNGDCSKDGKNFEVKVSLGGATHNKFNFVQIRPSHNCETYILTAYNLSSENVESEGELYIFKVPNEDIKKIVVSFGGYAHGTIKEYGKITIESLNNKKNTKEYALRPTINDSCWKALMSFKVSESGI